MEIPFRTVLTGFPPPVCRFGPVCQNTSQHIPYRSSQASSVSDFASPAPSWTAASDRQDSEELFFHLRLDVFSFAGMFEFLGCQRVSVGGGSFAQLAFLSG